MLHETCGCSTTAFPRDAHPMAILGSVVGAMSTFYQDSLNPNDKQQVDISIIRLLAQIAHHRGVATKVDGQPTNTGQLAVVCRELPKDDVRVAERTVGGRCRRGRGGSTCC